jgi:catechol 2,3-dioxygenase-like lactoylglutathione lyase family enzyme
MSGITHIGTVLVAVADRDAALAFWNELGFETRIDGSFGDGGRWIEVAPPGAQTSIALVPRGAGGAAGTEVSLATSDAEADHAALLRRGVDADPELIRMGEGVPPMSTFRDPDGNPFRVVERQDAPR